jgi:hypothetical protein
MTALPHHFPLNYDDDSEARAELIADLEAMQPQTKLGADLISLRLQLLRQGQPLLTLDEINRELGREEDADVH